MKKIQAWIEKYLVPISNKITSNYWFSIVADAILYIVPFSMVSAIPSLWSILLKFFPELPDLSPLSQYSFGLIGLFVVFIIPYNCLVKEEKKDRSLIAGFTGIGTFMLCMNITKTDGGSLVDLGKFGAGGMFTAMFVGLIVAVIYRCLARFSFFGEDSVLPDFVKNWFDNIIAILLSLFAGYIVTFVLKVDVFTMVQFLMKPVTGFAQSLPGFITIVCLQNIFYFFGISGWVFTPVTRTITQAAIAENAAMMAAGKAATNVYSFGASRYYHIGGQGATLPVAIMMLFAKSKRYRLLGKATIIPSCFNINEPLQYGAIVNNPFMFIPTVVLSILLPAITWLCLTYGFGTIHYVNFDMNFLPNPICAFIMSGGDWRNAVIVLINLAVAAVVWYPFFKAADKDMAEKEIIKEKEKAAKKAAKLAAKQAKVTEE
ncbi:MULTISPECIES: PTS sugar transporter subunit IIC [Bacillota]|jgi:cellobiose PTS system EIIC component|uniref:Permease IIC component n=1 Tax=[Eubacterium] hominis TaxID=2764325 RepID=A0A7G9GRZ2_9FIRM|nr:MULTISPECIES: PTS transporter subunit EIIC [Bacillota]QNM13574.1 PTS sugar transporter subunit IIC [[Eubacterium] hominis]RGB54978.1 PTS sugar transporter subunit IIC [Absiella sp. AM10-20]RGB56550.1 PTS sugar transporter subunit IIC [Absiella sp. AM22-9]RGB68586.1 PTS sugar transporter subunit IIC [Absiella sp. AM09-45]RGB78453.1 PTS sugar transporter subunit IIC [Absiella sp. AM09-50]